MTGLNYKSFDSLLSSVSEDLHSFDDNNLIVPKRYIKTVRNCNAELGIKLNRQEEITLEVSDYRADMPENLISIISLLGLRAEKIGNLHGTFHGIHTQELSHEEVIARGKNPDCYWFAHTQYRDILFKDVVFQVKPTAKSLKWFSEKSPNRIRCADTYQVDVSEGTLNFNFKEGTVHLAYLADMVDEDGGLVLLDHPLTDPYYEWAIKAKTFEILWHNSETDVQAKLQDARMQLGSAKQRAIDIVTTPEYRKLKEYTDRILRAYYDQYIKYIV